LYPIYRVNGQVSYLSASKIIHNKVPELQIIISFNKSENALQCYKECWQVETAFRALKLSGFNIEDTHLTDLRRVEKLFSIVTTAFARAYIVGVLAYEKVETTRSLKHGKRAKSLFKYGLELIATALLNPITIPEVDVFKFLPCT
jgi:transposase